MYLKSKLFSFLFSFSIVSLFLCSPVIAKEVPTQIGGIIIGSDIKSYPHLTESSFMKDVVLTDWYGFRKGVVSYGTCQHLDTILKIDLKYKRKDKDFFAKLLKEFRSSFGAPDQWKGDSFGVIHIWKWYFTDKEQNRVSLILQHNSKNPNETIGNMVKLSYPDKIAKEQRCFAEMVRATHEKTNKDMHNESEKTDWSYLIPR